MSVTIRQTTTPSNGLVAKQYDQGEYDYFDVIMADGACGASFAVGVRGNTALLLWTIHTHSVTFFRNCKTIALPVVKEMYSKRGCTMMISATGDPARDPDFDRVSAFFGFEPTSRTAAMEL